MYKSEVIEEYDMPITEELFQLQDKKYALFHSKLMPTVSQDSIIGIRVPELRKIAKRIEGSWEAYEFINKLPHTYYDENVLHGLLISGIKDYAECIRETEKFLPYVDNWAVCDIMSPKVFKKNKTALINKITKWSSSASVYECRFGIKMLMSHFLDESFKKKYLNIPAGVKSDEYYVKMMIAWFFATALAKQWKETIVYLECNHLDKWVHNKTIQKACESYRITAAQKEYLRGLKR